MHPTQHLASAFAQANSAHQHVIPADAENQRKITQSGLSVRNVPVKANVADHVVRHASIDSAMSSDSVISSDSANPTFASESTPCFTTFVQGSDVSDLLSPRPSITHSMDSGNASLSEDLNSSAVPKTTYHPVHGLKSERISRFIAPHFDHRGQASLTAKCTAAALKPSQRLLTYLMSDVLSRDVELGTDCHRHEAASALKAMAISAEATLHALDKENAVNNRHCAFIASLQRCEKVLTSLDDLHGYSRRSKHSSRRLILERTCTALQGIHERYDASRQILIDAHDKRPSHEVHQGDVDILLQPQNVIHLMRHGAGKSIAERERIADYQAGLLEVHRRLDADYAETSYRL